jgi:hypothetical protein
MRKREEREAARRLFVEERLGVPARTVRRWKDDGGWDGQQEEFLAQRAGDIESLRRFIRDLENAIAQDKKKRKTFPSPGRLHALNNARDQLLRMERAAAASLDAEEKEPPKRPPLTPENFLAIERDLFGLNANAHRR